jgi:very-short-patch-repair endonuclease
MRRQLLEYCYTPAVQVLPKDLSTCDSDFERDVAKELIQRSYRVFPQYPSAGKKIDLVVEGTTTRLAIECDGDQWHGPDRYDADVARQRILERCGWSFARVRGSAFYANRQREIARVLEALGAQGVEPVVRPEDENASRSWIEDVSGQECLESLRGNASPLSDSPPEADADDAKSLAPAHVDNSQRPKATDSACSDDDAAPDASQSLTNETTDKETQKSLPFESDPIVPSIPDAPGNHKVEENPEESQAISEITAYGASMWLRMSKWAKVNSILEPRERSLVYSVGSRLRGGTLPTFRQARWAKAILETAKQSGFDTTALD